MKSFSQSFSLRTLLLGGLLAAGLPVHAAGEGGHDMMDHDMAGHQHHMAAMANPNVVRSNVEIAVPDVAVVRQDGTRVDFMKELGSEKPVLLAFIYTTCTTICPVTSQILAQTQAQLGKEVEGVKIVSVSIDPEFDTPKKLTAYAKQYGASPSWQHYTGSLRNIVQIQKAFSAYRGDKMNHVPLFFISGGDRKSWVRFEGFPSAAQLVTEIRSQQEHAHHHHH